MLNHESHLSHFSSMDEEQYEEFNSHPTILLISWSTYALIQANHIESIKTQITKDFQGLKYGLVNKEMSYLHVFDC